MKELSIEEKAKAYDEAKARMSRAFNSNRCTIGFMNEIFPELRENWDERIRTKLIEFFSGYNTDEEWWGSITEKDILAWLEKQGEQKPADTEKGINGNNEEIPNSELKPADKVEPKFHKGDWVVSIVNGNIYHVINAEDSLYLMEHEGERCTFPWKGNDDILRAWNIIQDAKDGDVLASNRSIFIFSQEYMAGKPKAHCGIMNGLFIVKPEGCWTNEKCYPATKEQRDALIKAITDAGYTFDFEKKELKKIEHKSAWSEEDEVGLGDALWCCKQAASIAKDENDMGNIWYAENWLKSLRPQTTWKPSEEQLKALKEAVDEHFDIDGGALWHLYEDLKKLKS